LDPVKPPDFKIIDLTGGSNHHAHRNEEEFALEADIQHNIEEELDREAENQCCIDEQILLEAENQGQIEEQCQQQDHLVQAAQQVITEGGEQNGAEGENRVKL